jgi:hypothetical protein
MKMNLREAYKVVTVHLLEIAGERGEESLANMDSDEIALLAMNMINDENFTDKLVESAENFIEDFGEEYDLW